MSLSKDAHAICERPRSELRELFLSAAPVDLQAIAGYRYRGVSLGLPTWIERLSWKKFAKTFARTDEGLVRGYNLRIEQDALDRPWRPQMRRGKERRFGPYMVTQVPGTDHVEIDYGLGQAGLSPLRRLRDPLRSLDANHDLLLGCTQVDVGLARRVGTPSWFVLERDRPLPQ